MDDGGLKNVHMFHKFWGHAEKWYCKHGEPTGTLDNISYALSALIDLYGLETAAEFEPLKLKALREFLIDQGLSRGVVNKRINIVIHLFKWGGVG